MMDNLRGAALMVFAMLAFAVEDMFIKLMSAELPIGQILAMLGLIGGGIFAGIVRAQGRPVIERALLTGPIAIRAFGEMVGTLGFVSAIVLTPLSSASAILQATPLVVTLGAALFLGESVGWRRWSAVFIGLAGVLLIIRPGMADFEPLSLLALLGVVGLAMRDVATRRVPPQTSSMQLSALGFIVIVPGGLMQMWMTNTAYVLPSPHIWVYFFCGLIIGLFAYYAIVAAMRVGEVSFVTPFRYTRLIFAMVFGIAIFAERPDALTLIGSAVIVASGIYTVWREHRASVTANRNLSKPSSAR